MEVMDVDIEQQWGQDKSLGNTIFKSAYSTPLLAAGPEHKAAVLDQSHEEVQHIPIWQHQEEFQGQPTVPHSTRSTTIVPYVSQPAREAAGDQWWGWYDLGSSPKQPEWDAQQRDGPAALRVGLGLVRLREGDDSCIAPDFWDFTSF